MEMTCPNHEKCPIFNGVLAGKEITAKSYRRLYCEAGYEKYSACKRYMAKEYYGCCPGELLPNSTLSLQEIGVHYHLAPHQQA
ncbi:hypothetical protein [Geofilum rhodophaeum]|uniref:hypothetical protein n=1 Tax=Geofilum rhodophaeum TaxID=1965019 RepID=UPI000B52240A|nr:hypothetical protein [Geofilum rhodophaeum]